MSSLPNLIFPMYIYVFQTDIFGVCPTDFRVSESDPDVFYTERNLRLCEMPQIYSRPMNILSMIQRPYGGYKIGKVLEVFFFEFEILMHIGFLYNFFTIPKCTSNCLLEYICDFLKTISSQFPNVSTLLYKYENKVVYKQIL